MPRRRVPSHERTVQYGHTIGSPFSWCGVERHVLCVAYDIAVDHHAQEHADDDEPHHALAHDSTYTTPNAAAVGLVDGVSTNPGRGRLLT